MKTSFKFLLIFTVVIGSVALIGTHQAQALCQGETPYGHLLPLHVTRVGKQLSSDQNTLSVTVLGVPGMGCNGETITPISITASVVDTSISKSLSVDDVVATFDLNVSSLANGTYALRVRVTGGGSQTVNTPFIIERPLPPLPTGGPGIAAYSEYRTKLNNSYSFSVTNGPASTTGDLYQKIGGVWRLQQSKWLQTDVDGKATKGPWTCVGDRTDENIYIKWPDGTKTNEANHICVGLPTADINISPSSILRMTGPITISWSSSNNAEDCSGSILGLGLALGTSGNIDVNSDLNIFNPPTGGTGDPGPITGTLDVTFRCTNISGSSAQASDSTLIFHDLIVFTAKVKPSCSANNSTAVDMSQADADNIRFETRIVGGKDYFNNKPTKPDNRAWGGISATFKILHTGDTSTLGTPRDPRDISSYPIYAYCSDIGEFVFPPDNSIQRTTYPPIYFTPVCPGPRCTNPPLPSLNVSAVGECHQNYPESTVQSYISWNAIPGANSYTVAEDIPFWFDRTVGTTGGTSIIDRDLSFGSSYDYYVIAYNASGIEITRSGVVSTNPATPASCPNPPSGSGDTLDVIPQGPTINVNEQQQFTSIYDPDGPGGGRYGSFDVTSLSLWSAVKPATAQLLIASGLFKGLTAGTTEIDAVYRTLTAKSSLTVIGAGPNFSITIAPGRRDVYKPSSTSYDVTVGSLNGFSGTVNLAASNIPTNITTSFDGGPSAVVAGGGSVTKTLNFNIAAAAAVGISTFKVTGTSGEISNFVEANINVMTAFSCSVTPNPQSGTAPLTTSVSASGLGGTSPYQYQYDWTSDGSYDTNYVSSPQNHTYGSDGTYKITTRVKDANNTTALCDTSVNLPPNVCVGESCGGDGSPSVDLKINGSDGPLSVGYLPESFWGASLNVSWTAENVSSCSASADPSVTYWNGTLPAISSNTTAYILDSNSDPQTGTTYNFGISCNPTDEVEISVIECGPGTEGNPACQEVFPDECWVNASPSTVIPGQPSTLSWGCTEPGEKTCSIDQDIGEVNPNGGTYDVEPNEETTYTLSCTNVPNTSATVRVSFLKKIREIIPW